MGSKPTWLKKKVFLNNSNINKVKTLLENSHLHTVCQSAKCPNIFECFGKETATFMILGNVCTRNCAFCGIKSGKPSLPDIHEPKKVALAAREMDLKYVVITSVTRDDLPDGGASHFAKTVKEIRKLLPSAGVECLIPDFGGDLNSLKIVLGEEVSVLNHNVETVKRNYPEIRRGASYEVSLGILKMAKEINPNIFTKSSFMVGLGETRKEIEELLMDLSKADVDILTIGQYLRPSVDNVPVHRYYTPQEFEELKLLSKRFGFKKVVCGT
ncbi:MAG: lipoyl synthase, partial [Actinobacteria bacterium]|nr:lipoyl synthase [Actinomycetota bacterium]